jgi:hypothetical protein
MLMRVRAHLLIAAFAATLMGIAVTDSSGATLFTTTAHTTRVTVGATAVADVVGNFDFTLPPGTVNDRCTGGAFDLVVEENSDVRVSLRVASGGFTGCVNAKTPTFPWTVTITGAGTVRAPNLSYAATVHRVAYDIAGLPGVFTGNLETGVTALQPTAGTSPITLNFENAASLSNPSIGTENVDANLRLTTPWSLTN